MRGSRIAAIVVGAAVLVVVLGIVVYRMVVDQAGPAFEKSFNESFLDSCLKSAREAAAKQGRTGPEVDAIIQTRCNCALEVVKPLPVSDKVALGRSRTSSARCWRRSSADASRRRRDGKRR